MIKSEKHNLLGGRYKTSSKKLSEWGSLGGRPRKWKNEAERKRFNREKKKLTEQGKPLNPYRSYGSKRFFKALYGLCSNCGLRDDQYLRYGWEHYRWTANSDKWVCHKCYSVSIEKNEVYNIQKRAGSSAERSRRSRSKKRSKADFV